ncbi:DNA polymerase [Staphylococcus phage MVC_VPHSA1]|uniref:DNA polymerase n=1 Tax=Staphylococcus phage MVC_VPHSA1 TaxID=3088876 RepID=A0ABZ0QYN8_9CAUD|nr:DNA polymerase [Staphylococcus phage MVC_VPHSA1]
MTDKLQVVQEKQTVSYVEIHTHSCGSFKDAHSRVDKLVARAKELGQKLLLLLTMAHST